jgi:hypothetical protein
MNVIIGVALTIFGVVNFISVVTEIFGRMRIGSDGAEEWSVARRRRILLHLAVYALIVVGFWAIVHFGPLRPVHEWLR